MDRRGAVHRAKGEFAGRHAALYRAQRLIAQGEQACGVIEQHLARRGQLQTLALTHEQLYTHLLFKLFEPGRQIGRYAVQTFSCTGDRTFFGHGLKNS